jgi:hypothetical protein
MLIPQVNWISRLSRVIIATSTSISLPILHTADRIALQTQMMRLLLEHRIIKRFVATYHFTNLVFQDNFIPSMLA